MDWTPRRTGVDETAFGRGRLGPYRLGRRIRATALGEVTLAIGDPFEEVVTIERCHLLLDTALAGPDGQLLGDVAHIVGLRHRHLVPVLGAGTDARVPYLVRGHHLGVTLEDTIEVAKTIDRETSAVILHAVLDATAFLADEGPQPGVCSLGGFSEEDILLGYDGSIAMMSTGLRLVRCPSGDPRRADLASAHTLAQRLDPSGDLANLFSGTSDPAAVAIRTRHRYRDACGSRGALVGRLLRRHFDRQIHADRVFYGLPTLH